MYLSRNIDRELTAWRQEKQGKPLLVRGARQVGKSTTVRHLAGEFDHFLEVNFEEQRQVHTLFEGDLWLQSFAYRTPLNGWMFIAAGAAAIGLALLTVGFQAMKAALADPVKSLRTE